MAKKKKNSRLTRPRKFLLILGLVVLAIAIVALGFRVQHNRAVSADKARFEQANKDVQTVAGQVIAAIGQPADRKDGGKCSYAHQEFSKGSLSCEVYSYLAYGVNSPDDVNAIVQKALSISALNGNPWRFKAVSAKPYETIPGVNNTDQFVALRSLFDSETKSITYNDALNFGGCGVGFLYHNSLSTLSGYPNFSSSSSQTVLIDISCAKAAATPFFSVED